MLKGIAISCLSKRAQQDRGKDPVFCRALFTLKKKESG